LVTRFLHPQDASTRVPTQITCQIFKQQPARSAQAGGGSITTAPIPSTSRRQQGTCRVSAGHLPGEGRAV